LDSIIVNMEYFDQLQQLLQQEHDVDQAQYEAVILNSTTNYKRDNGICWYPLSIKGTEIGKGEYITVELERTTHTDISHQFRSGTKAALFSNLNILEDRVEGQISYINGNKLKLALRVDELPEWTKQGKLGIEMLFDENSYQEMFSALKQAGSAVGNTPQSRLIDVLVGKQQPSFNIDNATFSSSRLNASQQVAVQKIVQAEQLAIIHGPPGTGKTTTLVQAIKALWEQDHAQILVTAASNAAVDLLTEQLQLQGLNVVRAGNPNKVLDSLMQLTLDNKVMAHPMHKEIKKMRKQAQAYKDMAHKYKRNFGKAEREQRKALFDEAHKVMKEVERTENYIVDSILSEAQVITATLIGTQYHTIKQRTYKTLVIDEAGQAIEPACWVPILKAQKVVMAGDHQQLPPTLKSEHNTKKGLSITLMEKCVQLYPEAVTLLQEQYRMHEQIMGFSSSKFYNNKLTAHETVASRHLLNDTIAVTFIDTAGCGYQEEQQNSSITNSEEASFLQKHLHIYLAQLSQHYTVPNFPSIGILSPYRAQVNALQTLLYNDENLKALLPFITINTIDSFQGQERDIMYISLTRSNTEGVIGFLSDIRRMNVAMTRAKQKLIVIGDSATLASSDFYHDFIAYAESMEGWVSAWEFAD
jgi:ATP-dependent RNA/DNA helicase IGHMBP2